MEELYVLGTGNATSIKSYNTCFVIKDGNELFMTDSGGGNGLLLRLEEMHLRLEDIHHVFVSHCHMDHCLGVLWMIRVLSVKMAKGDYEGTLRIYGHAKVLHMLDEFCRMMLRDKFYKMIGKYVFFEEVEPKMTKQIGPWMITFYDIGSNKELQYGYKMKLKNGKTLVFTGDEPLKKCSIQIGEKADWLLREVLCCHEDEQRFHAYEKKHDTVKEACELAVSMHV
ncbi:MAG: MBL fold metallo-hydrolase, partial [Bariatricus sp.]